MSSSAGPAAAKEDVGKGTKRSPEAPPETQTLNDKEIGPSTPKTAKPNPPADDGDGKGEGKTAPARGASESAPEATAVTAKADASGPSDSERVEAEALRSLGLAVGTRLEVMWLLEEEDKSIEKVGFE